MEFFSINVTEPFDNVISLKKLFEDKLKAVLGDGRFDTALYLREEVPAGISLIGWMDEWNKRFVKIGRQLIIVTATPQQFQTLELSHPDQKLRYVQSPDDLQRFAAHSAAPTEQHKPQAAPTPVTQVLHRETVPDAPPPEPAETPAAPPPAAAPANNPMRQAPPFVAVGGRISLAGEYVCGSCGIPRMWMKGDTTVPCVNTECTNTKAGWTLTWELF